MDKKIITKMTTSLLKTLKSDNEFYEALNNEVKRRGLENHPKAPNSADIQSTKENLKELIKLLEILKDNLEM